MTKKKKPLQESLPTQDIQRTPEQSEKPTQEPAFVKKLLPTHWAREAGIDEHLFLAWNDNAITKAEWEALKAVVSRRLR
jgi:hypothetical protein